jgi:hypothetical protein
MDKTVQTNVRVAPSDRALIVTLAQRLRNEPGFRDRVKALLDDSPGSMLSDQVKKLEQQVGWLLSGAIVMPRLAPRHAAVGPHAGPAPENTARG